MSIPLALLEENARKIRALEQELRENELLSDPKIQFLLKTINEARNQRIFDSKLEHLFEFLKMFNTDAQRTYDSFRPYGPEVLLNQGDLHLLDQMDGVKFSIDPDKLLTGALVLGPQGMGKSRLITSICKQLSIIRPDIKVLILDPKNGFSSLSVFRHLDLGKMSFDLSSPLGVEQDNYITEFMPILANITSVIFGVDFFNRAVDDSLSQLRGYGGDTTLCLKDIYESLAKFKPKSFRTQGYLDAAKFGLSQLLGPSNIFSCRKGLSLDWLFGENTVINARCLTGEVECKGLLNYLLFWLYQKYRNVSETKVIKHLLIIDDSTRFVGVPNTFHSEKRTSPLGHILAVLRSAGVAVMFATQIPSQIDPAVLALSRNMFVVGNINGENNLRVLQSYMSLTPEQKSSILRFQKRESLAFISGSAWSRPVHGWVPFVPDEAEGDVNITDCSNMIVPWHSLTEVPKSEAPKPIKQVSNVNTALDKLLLDCIHYPYSKVREHIDRMGVSVRVYETAVNSALQEGYLLHSMSGKSVYLIPTKQTYDKFNVPVPYERSVSVEHSFYVGLAAHLSKQCKGLKVQTETPAGQKGATIDVTLINGKAEMFAVEITLNTGNLLSNAAKLQDTSYKKIVWLTKDAASAKAVKAYFNKITSLPNELIDKFEYSHFSKFNSFLKKGIV
ncbi:Type IV secretory pathway, VirB4 component [Limihaloglobus sulfuriphilus]|uniref:Type IV secretory pathway, VirB4 component n=1 Tax=Limihaloglobus sulfuriphilus TaxID=1851148 RepID=A0A1Q2MFF4_9BACT|nr:DUF87 domain-containing protein [Limihaloglobus sulfuriphilus]AQQ71400.1 Type IV secretory pathway, VirB4 component [Limihaloglobus sulfuriphilus]